MAWLGFWETSYIKPLTHQGPGSLPGLEDKVPLMQRGGGSTLSSSLKPLSPKEARSPCPPPPPHPDLEMGHLLVWKLRKELAGVTGL